MDESIDKIIDLAGTRHSYQILLLIISFLCWTNNLMLSVSLPFLEKVPDIAYKDPLTGELMKGSLNYTVCDWEKNYTITKQYDYSWVIETDVICKRTETGLIGVTSFLGDCFAALLFNLIADTFGRRKCLLFGSALFITFNTVLIFINGFYPIIILNFFINFASLFTTYSTLVLSEEMTSMSLRGIFGSIINAGYPCTALVYFPLFDHFENWRAIVAINVAVAGIMFLVFLFFIRESPRYYIARGNISEALRTVEDLAKFHKIEKYYYSEIEKKEYTDIIEELDNIFVKASVKKSVLEEKDDVKRVEQFNNMMLNEKMNGWALIKYPSIRYRFLILCYLAFFIAGSHNGLSIYMKNLPGDLFKNGMLFYSFEVLASFVSGWLINTRLLGRKGTLLLLYLISSITFFLFLFDSFNHIAKIIIYLIVKTSISGIFTIMYIYFLENYPTSIRALGFGINTAVDSIGGSIFPFLTEYFSEKVLFITLGALNVSQFILMMFMPETRNKPLPESIDEVEEERSISRLELFDSFDQKRDAEKSSLGIDD